MGSGVSVEGCDRQSVHDALLTKFAALKCQDTESKLPDSLPDSLERCVLFEVGQDADPVVQTTYNLLAGVFEDKVAKLSIPEVSTDLRSLPDAIDEVVYRHERWPVIVDTNGQGTRFLKYQRGTFIMMDNILDTQPENLRKSLVAALQHGTMLVLVFNEAESLHLAFDKDHFPPQVLMNKSELFKEEIWGPLLRPGDPTIDLFAPKDEFKVIITSKIVEVATAFARENRLAILTIQDSNQLNSNSKTADTIASAFGARDIKRNSQKLVEAAFDDEWDELQAFLDKGYSHESEDAHGHTPLSEASCQGNNDIVEKLLAMDADPNSQNDIGRTPLFRACYNGHIDTVILLLQHGADPRLTSSMDSAFDVAKNDEIRNLLTEWDVEDTERLILKRKLEIEEKMEARLSTAAERDIYAREKIRQELVSMAIEGNCQALKERLQELADEALQHNERPRGNAEARDERGNTLLLLSVWKNNLEMVEMLLTTFEKLDPEFEKLERKVFFSSINARDAKGWNACAVATFHGHKHVLEYLLSKDGDPYIKNSYNKNSFDLAKDDLDAARAVLVDKSEIRNVLINWEKEKNPRVAGLRQERKDSMDKTGEVQKPKKKKTKKKKTKK